MVFLLDIWYWFLLIITRSDMGVRENKVERFLDSEIMKLGGITRKWVSPGVNGVPDRIVIFKGNVWFVEVKTVDGRLSSWQEREIKRLKGHGVNALVVYGEREVKMFIDEVKHVD